MKKLISTDNEAVMKKASIPLFYVGILLLWQFMTSILNVPDYILPSPYVICLELINSFPLLLMHARITVIEVLTGFGIALFLSVVLSIAMDRYRYIKDLLYPMMVITQTVPIMAIAPLMMIWFGFGLMPKIIVVVLVCFFPIAVSLTEGLASVDPELIDLMKTMNASESQIFLKCKLPASMPSFFAGLRIAATYSVMGAVVSEWVGAQEGLGIFMTRVMKSYRTPALFAVILFIIAITLIFVAIIDTIGRKTMPWSNERRSLK
ncbi:MAG: ABC transporter permease protein [Clostridiales bacterium 38_11]|nr:MAG: ABC transporter permease protein [Clostridiales bacterium 38_11]HBH11557.1 ABC transporter permease [Clostridiales bacterium]